MKLRLIVTTHCERNCPKCCNKHHNPETIPSNMDYSRFSEIILTGGEPMLHPYTTFITAYNIRLHNPRAKIYLQTAKAKYFHYLLPVLDGITFTLHDDKDISELRELTVILECFDSLSDKSLWLNVMEEVNALIIPKQITNIWTLRLKSWQDYCPVPKGEILMRL